MGPPRRSWAASQACRRGAAGARGVATAGAPRRGPRAGRYLLDRATAAVVARLGAERRTVERSAARLAPVAVGRLTAARARLESTRGSLVALDPEATLARGYAIVRRAADGTIVRAPVEAPAGTALRLRVARGEIAVHVDDGA